MPGLRRELAGDGFAFDGALDPVDGRRMAVVAGLGGRCAVDGLDPLESDVDGAGEVCTGASGLARADRTFVNDDDFLAFAGEEIRARQSSDAGANDADIGGS